MSEDSETALARAVLIHGPISRSALTSRLELSSASLTRLARPLLDRGLLVELDEIADGSVGRPTRPLDIAPDAGRFIGIKLTGDRLYAVRTGIRADPVATREVALTGHDPDAALGQILDVIGDLDVPRLTGVGISLGGIVRGGVVEHGTFLDWHDVPLAARLGARLNVPVTVENDLVALAEAERWFGLGRQLPGFVVLTIGAGVGYALVINGNTVRTPDAGMGAAGHIPLAMQGPICADGHLGCARALLTSGSIAGQVSVALERHVTFGEALRLARTGEPAARSVIDQASAALGTLIALATNMTLQPDVILAGEGVALYEQERARVTATIAAHRNPQAQPVTVTVDDSDFHAWARGAAAVAIQAALPRLSMAVAAASRRA